MMHTNEIYIDLDLAKILIQNQFPNWATLPLSAISSNGTDNVIYRLGEDLAIRLPRTASSAENIAKEFLWLPKLANFISSPIPEPVALGHSQESYPYHWLIFKWQSGQNGTQTTFDLNQAAEFLANFIGELHKVDTNNAPLALRGRNLNVMQSAVQEALPKMKPVIDIEKTLNIWENCLGAPIYQGKPVWVHSDLHAGNILVQNHQIVSVIDFGMAGIGDPSCDMMPAWSLLDSKSRNVFKNLIKIDDATWQRGKGWALAFGLVAYPYYQHINPVLAKIALDTIKQVLI